MGPLGNGFGGSDLESRLDGGPTSKPQLSSSGWAASVEHSHRNDSIFFTRSSEASGSSRPSRSPRVGRSLQLVPWDARLRGCFCLGPGWSSRRSPARPPTRPPTPHPTPSLASPQEDRTLSFLLVGLPQAKLGTCSSRLNFPSLPPVAPTGPGAPLPGRSSPSPRGGLRWDGALR